MQTQLYPCNMLDLEFVSIGCNLFPNCLIWNKLTGLAAFGAYSSVAIFDPAV